MYKTRKLENTILRYLSKREIIAIIGPRQSGKTTLLQKIQSELPSSIFISFEDRDDLELLKQTLGGLLRNILVIGIYLLMSSSILKVEEKI